MIAVLLGVSIFLASSTGFAQAANSPVAIDQPFFGDLDRLRERQLIRVLVTNSRSNYFTDRDQVRGFEYEQMEQFKAFLNRQQGKSVEFRYVVMPFSQLIPSLIEGKGDLIAANLTITPERQLKLGFSNPYLNNVKEVLVSHRAANEIRKLSDLAGRRHCGARQ